MESRASATWEGDLLEEVSWPSRTEAANGKTSPEELIAAAHAACYSMALSHGLSTAGNPPTRLDTKAVATFEQTEAGWRLTTMSLKVRGEVPGITADEFEQAAADAKDGCPVSNALAGNVAISFEATLT